MNNVKIKLFGELGEYVKFDSWELDVKSVQEAIHAINTLTNNRFSEYFFKKNKLYAKYRILINGRDFMSPVDTINENNWELYRQSELVIKKNDLKTIDIVPILESDDTHSLGLITAILGAVLIVVGVILIATGVGSLAGIGLIFGGLALLGAGVVALLSKPPTFNYNQDLSNSVSQSYLFNGPINTVGEGNPVPVGYGTILVGSNVVSEGYKITTFQTENN